MIGAQFEKLRGESEVGETVFGKETKYVVKNLRWEEIQRSLVCHDGAMGGWLIERIVKFGLKTVCGRCQHMK